MIAGAAAASCGKITSNSSDLFSVTGSVTGVSFTNCYLSAGSAGGHVFNGASSASLSFVVMNGVRIDQNNSAKSIWSQLGGTWTFLIDCHITDCWFNICAGATVPAWNLAIQGNGCADLKFGRSRFHSNLATVPFMNFDQGSATGWNEDIRFEHVNFEQTCGGAIHMTACMDVVIEQCMLWDIPDGDIAANQYSFTTSSAGYPCRNIQLHGGKASNNAAGSGYSDLYCDWGTTNIYAGSWGTWATPPVITAPTAQLVTANITTVSGASPSVQAPGSPLPGSVPTPARAPGSAARRLPVPWPGGRGWPGISSST